MWPSMSLTCTRVCTFTGGIVPVVELAPCQGKGQGVRGRAAGFRQSFLAADMPYTTGEQQ